MKTLGQTEFVQALAERCTQGLTNRENPFLIGICGGADTGKSTLAASLQSVFKTRGVEADLLSTDAFLKDRSARQELGLSGFNPAAVDEEEMTRAIGQLCRGESYTYFPYINKTGTHAQESKTLKALKIVIIEGIHAFHPVLAVQMNYKLFLDARADVLKQFRIRANVEKRGMNARDSTTRVDFEMQEFQEYTAPLKSLADYLITVSPMYNYKPFKR